MIWAVEWVNAYIGSYSGSGALIVVLSMVLVISCVTVALAAWFERAEEAAMRSRCAREAEAARRKGGCAVRYGSGRE